MYIFENRRDCRRNRYKVQKPLINKHELEALIFQRKSLQ